MKLDKEVVEEWRREALEIETYRENKLLRRIVQLTEELLNLKEKESKEKFHKGIHVCIEKEGDLVLFVYANVEGKPYREAKYIYGRIKVGFEDAIATLTGLELEIEQTKQEMYDILLQKFPDNISGMYLYQLNDAVKQKLKIKS